MSDEVGDIRDWRDIPPPIPEPVTRLYLVMWVDIDDGDNTNYDLIVLAENPAQAAVLWNEYYAEHWGDHDDETGKRVMRMPEHIVRIPEEELLCRKPRALVWNDMDYENISHAELLAAVSRRKATGE